MPSFQTPAKSFAVGDERGFVAFVSQQTGAIEAIRDGRLAMSLRELSDVDFIAASEPITLRYLAPDLPAWADPLGRQDVLQLSTSKVRKTIEVCQGKSLGGVIRVKLSDVSSPIQYGIDCRAETKTTGRWLLNVGPATPFTIDCIAFSTETGEPIVEVSEKPLTFFIDRPSHIILTIRGRKLLEDTCILTDNWQIAAVLSSLFCDPTRYLPVLPVRSVPPFFAKRQLTSVRQCLHDQQPTRIIFAGLPTEIEREILWGIPNLGTVERYGSLEEVYRLLPVGDPVVCSPRQMATGLLTAKRMGKGLVFEERRESRLDAETIRGARDAVLVEGPSLASVVAVNYAYFREADLIDVGEIEGSRLAWFDQKCGEIDDLCARISELYGELAHGGKPKAPKRFLISSFLEFACSRPGQGSVAKQDFSVAGSSIKVLAKAQKDNIVQMREAIQQILAVINNRWASLTAFTEGVPYSVGLNLPCGLIPKPIAAHYIFDEIYGEIQRASPTFSLLVVDPGTVESSSEIPQVVNQVLGRRSASRVVSGKEATKDILHSYLKFFPYDFLLLVTHGSRTEGKIALYGSESLSQDDLVYLTEMNNLKRPLVLNNACSSWYAVGRNFLWFGARAYVGTMWSVWTDSAAEIAKHFSRHLFALSMAQSLFKAKQTVARNDSISSSAYIFVGSALSRCQALEAAASEVQKAIDLLVDYDLIRVGGIQQTPPQELTQHHVPKRLDYIFRVLADHVLSKAPLLQPYVDFMQAHWLSQLVEAEIPHSYPTPGDILKKAIVTNRGNLKTLERDTSLDESDKAVMRQILRRNIPMSLVNLGIEYRREAKKELAINCFSEAAGLFEELGDYVGMGDSLLNWGITLRRSQHDESRERLQAAKSYYLRAGDQRKTAVTELTLGDLARDEQMWQTAKAHYLTAKQISSTLGDYQDEIEAALLASEMDTILGEMDSALGVASEMVDFCDRRGLIELSCRARLLQAVCFLERNQPELAMSCIVDALSQSRRLPGPKVFNRVMKGLLQAILVAVRKDYREAVVRACRRVKSDWPAAGEIQSTMTAIELACLGRPRQAREAVASLGEPFVSFVKRLISFT